MLRRMTEWAKIRQFRYEGAPMLFIRSLPLAALACFGFLAISTPASAQVAGQRMGACPERVYLNADQRRVAAAMALLDDSSRRGIIIGRGSDDTIAIGMRQCARSIRYAVCTDGMLLGLIDPKGALIGGAAGLLWNGMNGGSTVIGGLLGAGVVGMTRGVINAGQCRKRQAEILPAAKVVFTNWRISTQSVRGAEIDYRVRYYAQQRAISADHAQAILSFINQATAILNQ
ncbi:hypothetical protein [Breoghania sp. L-A4]|uniref:hypothetical protein n=1 Tax=Breoghania sp. L-A4 TaxID=2304600 RepID=UPI000E358AB9|nr:hypothetical protein [Breoghania sp. L-A4]AXS40842.1 hypothetical protein D1F64_13315 [Breoghania sp. L-A4]